MLSDKVHRVVVAVLDILGGAIMEKVEVALRQASPESWVSTRRPHG